MKSRVELSEMIASIRSEDSPVGMDAVYVHAVILDKLIEIEARLPDVVQRDDRVTPRATVVVLLQDAFADRERLAVLLERSFVVAGQTELPSEAHVTNRQIPLTHAIIRMLLRQPLAQQFRTLTNRRMFASPPRIQPHQQPDGSHHRTG